jgi:hypothetical protein
MSTSIAFTKDLFWATVRCTRYVDFGNSPQSIWYTRLFLKYTPWIYEVWWPDGVSIKMGRRWKNRQKWFCKKRVKKRRNTSLCAAEANKKQNSKKKNLPLWPCLNSLHHFQPRFPFPSFHGGNQVNQPNDLTFAVLLQSSQTTHMFICISAQTWNHRQMK